MAYSPDPDTPPPMPRAVIVAALILAAGAALAIGLPSLILTALGALAFGA